MEIPNPNPNSAEKPAVPAPEADDSLVVAKPDDEMTQADWDPRAGSPSERAAAASLKSRMRTERPEFRPDPDDGRLPRPAIRTFAEAKAFNKWQDAQEPEAQAAVQAMQTEREKRARDQADDLARQAQQIANNPNAITGIPDNRK